MARMPGVQWRPISTNFRRGGCSPRIVTIHKMQGTLSGTDSWFRNSSARVSSHFGVAKNGTIRQWVDTSDTAWAQGNGNSYCLSIENEGNVNEPLTEAQLDACAEILAWANRVHGVPRQRTTSINGRGLAYHSLGGSTWGGPTGCPGSRVIAQLVEIVKRAGGSAGGGGGGGSTPGEKAPAWPGRVFIHTPGRTMMTGTDIRRWQQRMRDRGWSLAVDGVYGPGSTKIARQFQQEKKLLVDGKVGKQTWTASWEAPVT